MSLGQIFVIWPHDVQLYWTSLMQRYETST